MQGIAGHYYALRDGAPADVARAVEQHWWPKQAGDALPEDALGRSVALADRLDALVGIFGAGQKPTGARDPFALRRAAIAVCRLLVEPGHPLELGAAIAAAARVYAGPEGGAAIEAFDADEVRDFVIDRLRVYLVEQIGRPADAVEATLVTARATGATIPSDIDARVRAIETFRSTPAAVSLSRAAKRCANLLKKADADEARGAPDAARFVEPAERALGEALDAVRPGMEAALARGDYADAMTRTAALAEPVDRFFDEVMVMHEDAGLRANRLALLATLDGLANRTAALSRLALGDGPGSDTASEPGGELRGELRGDVPGDAA